MFFYAYKLRRHHLDESNGRRTESYVRVDSADLQSRQIRQIDGDLAVLSGGRGPAERDVTRLNEREEAAGDAYLVDPRGAPTVSERRQQQPQQCPQLDSLWHLVNPCNVQSRCRRALPAALTTAF